MTDLRFMFRGSVTSERKSVRSGVRKLRAHRCVTDRHDVTLAIKMVLYTYLYKQTRQFHTSFCNLNPTHGIYFRYNPLTSSFRQICPSSSTKPATDLVKRPRGRGPAR